MDQQQWYPPVLFRCRSHARPFRFGDFPTLRVATVLRGESRASAALLLYLDLLRLNPPAARSAPAAASATRPHPAPATRHQRGPERVRSAATTTPGPTGSSTAGRTAPPPLRVIGRPLADRADCRWPPARPAFGLGALNRCVVRSSSYPAARITVRNQALNTCPGGSRGNITTSATNAPSGIAASSANACEAGRAARSGSSRVDP